MNKRDNPYTPGAGRKPRTLAGRDQDLESFQSLVERLDAGSYERSLIYTGLTIAEIAYDLGFVDPAYFTRFFAREAGEPPGEFRRRHRAGDAP